MLEKWWDENVESARCLKLSLIEGEEIIGLVSHEEHLYCQTSLGRIFKSTEVNKMEHFDMVEMMEIEDGRL